MRQLTILTLIAASTALSACGTVNQSLDSVHQPVVSRTDYVFDVAAPSGDRMSEADADRLSSWFDSLGLAYGDQVSVDGQGVYGAREAVAGVAARYGLLVQPEAPVTQGAVAPGAIRVVVSRMTAVVPGCPDFSRPSSPEFGGNRTSNYGCAFNSNIAAMIADPRDLITGRSGTAGVNATVATKAIATYRSKVPTGAGDVKPESTKGN